MRCIFTVSNYNEVGRLKTCKMKHVLLTLDNPSEILKKYLDEVPYAIRLLEKRMTQSYTIEPRPEEINRKEENKTVSPYDRVPHTHHQYEQSCIVYSTKEDLLDDNGMYQDCLPEEVEGNLYEYTAKLV